MDPIAQDTVPHTDDSTTTTTPTVFEFSQPQPDAPPVTFEMARNAVAKFYGIEVRDIDHVLHQVASVPGPRKPIWSKFGKLNKFGFLYGILMHTPDKEWQDDYIRGFYWTFRSNRLMEKAEEEQCLNLLYARFIQPFTQGSSNASPHGSSGSTPNGSSTPITSNATDPTHSNFSTALRKRDVACLICWDYKETDATHLIAQKTSIPLVIEKLLERAGMHSVFQVQNGVLLCSACHRSFDALKQYIDVVDGCLIAKIVNTTNDPNDKEYLRDLERLTGIRAIHKKYQYHADIADLPSELPVYIPLDDETMHPNHTALAFHKVACMIWKLAGAGAVNEDDWSGDGEDEVENRLAMVASRLEDLEKTSGSASPGLEKGMQNEDRSFCCTLSLDESK
ncbi:hypothetical protein CcCBS67573_g09183 [Chytriomyces confervae]|uniref:HNH nuclease domain-containing protein n=1 Tax=Chytriomyces confervae TaxID=246404 RepID=A0A507E491_9FUNG|nr:hypothetical protein CcCBS67573_g09183 [Chytriomyces confervae]